MKQMQPEVMLKQIDDLGNLLRINFQEIDNNVKEAFSLDILKRIQRVYTVGDGDSWHASMSVEMAFGEFARLEYIPMCAMRFLEYGAEYIPMNFPSSNLVIGISASGSSTRVVQTMEKIQNINGEIVTACLVGNPDSKVANISRKVISAQIPSFGPSPGIRTYVASMLGLYALAIRIGEAKSHYTHDYANALRKEIVALSSFVDETAKSAVKPCKVAAKALKEAPFISFVGSGPSFGTAYFSSAKVVEAAGIFSVAQDLEEWAHVEGLAYPLDFPVYMICPPGKGYWRAVKLARMITRFGHPLVVIGNSEDDSMKEVSDFYFPVQGKMQEVFSPLVYHVASNLFACYLAKELGRLPFMMDNEEATKYSEFVTKQIKEQSR
ncbi:MAG TPA: hypothetical protein G4N92_00470 [Anaerolineae bacterium]|nr:hypothetical protein [Anaerolineae bacterium]